MNVLTASSKCDIFLQCENPINVKEPFKCEEIISEKSKRFRGKRSGQKQREKRLQLTSTFSIKQNENLHKVSNNLKETETWITLVKGKKIPNTEVRIQSEELENFSHLSGQEIMSQGKAKICQEQIESNANHNDSTLIKLRLEKNASKSSCEESERKPCTVREDKKYFNPKTDSSVTKKQLLVCDGLLKFDETANQRKRNLIVDPSNFQKNQVKSNSYMLKK